MFTYIKRIGLFLITNFLILMTLSFLLNLIAPYFGIDPNAYYSKMLLFSVVFGFGGAFVSLMLSKFMAKSMMGVKIIDPRTHDPRERWLVDTTHNYAKAAGLSKMPEVGIYEAHDVNAFATGPSKNTSLVAVSTGLLNVMNKEEAEGVIGHEIAHIANGDMVTMTLIQGVINAMVIFFARILANLVASQMRSQNDNNSGGGLAQFGLVMLFEVVFSLLGMVVVAWFSRYREFRADAGGARFAGRSKMISGLRKLQRTYEGTAQQQTQEAFATMQISGRKKGGLMALLSTHPPLEERIRRLELGHL